MQKTFNTDRKLIARLALAAAIVCGAPDLSRAELGPQGTVRQFCQADAGGQRLSAAGWAPLSSLVAWSLEPAWDQVVLITGYTLREPHPDDGGGFTVEVRYDVIGQVSALGLDAAVYTESVVFQVRASDAGGWRIIGPPPPPHIFGNRVDVETMRRSLEQGGIDFLTNSSFVWHMFRSAGWDVVYVRAAELLDGSVYRSVDQPHAGDLAVYLRDGTPYHVGVLEAENQIVSSTLNAGITRSAIDAFAGEVKYLRLVAPEPAPRDDAAATPTPTGSVERHGAPPRRRPPARAPTPRRPASRRTAPRSVRKPTKKTAKAKKPHHGRRVRAAPSITHLTK